MLLEVLHQKTLGITILFIFCDFKFWKLLITNFFTVIYQSLRRDFLHGFKLFFLFYTINVTTNPYP